MSLIMHYQNYICKCMWLHFKKLLCVFSVMKKISCSACYLHTLTTSQTQLVGHDLTSRIQLLYEQQQKQQQQTCITNTETLKAELLLLITISLGASAGCWIRAIWVYTDTLKLSFSFMLAGCPSNGDEGFLSEKQVVPLAHLKYSVSH